jgi:hypothetical protein
VDKGPGRPKELVGKQHGQFLKAIAEINSKNKKRVTDQDIAGKLMERPEYRPLSERQLRRKVAEAINGKIRFLQKIRPEFWGELLGISPPAKFTRKALREKVFEHLRHELQRQNELMAKKQ